MCWIRVRITPQHYGRALSCAVKLAEELKASIPFEYEPKEGPDIQILGGDRVRNIMCIEMVIVPQSKTKDDAVKELRERRFWNYEEPLITG